MRRAEKRAFAAAAAAALSDFFSDTLDINLRIPLARACESPGLVSIAVSPWSRNSLTPRRSGATIAQRAAIA